MNRSEQNSKHGLRQTNAWGIDLRYRDALEKWHEPPAGTVEAIKRAMQTDGRRPAGKDSPSPVVFLHAGQTRALPAAVSITLETGETIDAPRALPPDLPLGYHTLHSARGEQRLIVAPKTCYLPELLKTWGWAVQLYAARSHSSWGIGDLSDLEKLARWSGEKLGAGMLLVNPLSAATPTVPQQSSPYYPTSRCFFNPLCIDIEQVAGMMGKRPSELAALEQAGRSLNHHRLIDRSAIFPLKMRALELLWEQFPGDPSFTRFQQTHGDDLQRFATFCALAENHQAGWHSWPRQFQHPASDAISRFADENRARIDFHKWLQWLIDRQLARCARHLSLMQDLPIGVDPDGADAWAWQEIFAKGMAVGAPPDEFNTQGQNWGLPPFDPHKLRAAAYEPFIRTIRAAFRHCGGLRIDHVTGLFRLFWIPQGAPAREGAYVRYHADELLSIVALESQKAQAYVVGEDLGTVEEEARAQLASHKILSYRLLWFEKDDTRTYPQNALAAITTHDLPTVAGLWTGSDLAKQHHLGLNPNDEGTAEIHRRLSGVTGLNGQNSVSEVIASSYQVLARAPSRILTAALDDAAAVEERPNLPATTAEKNPNWSVALPIAIDDLMGQELPAQIAAALRRSS